MAKKGHIDQRLSDVSIQYPQGEFVGDALFPVYPVDKGSDYFTVYDKGNLFKNVDDTMGKFSQARQVQHGTSTDSYSVVDRALRDFVPQEDIDNADDPLNPEIDATEVVTNAILLQREIRQHALGTSLSVNTASPGTKWDAASGYTPVSDIQDAINSMFVKPNVMVMGIDVWNVLKFNSDILDHFQGGNTGYKMATIDMLKAMFDLDEIKIGDARKNASKDPKAASLSRVWSDDVVLARVNKTRSIKVPTFGWTFAQKMGKGKKVFQVRTYEDESRGVGGGKWIQVEHRSVEKLVSEDFGYYISNTLT